MEFLIILSSLIAFALQSVHSIPTPSSHHPVVVKKCCPLNEVLDVYHMKCKASGARRWEPTVHKDPEQGHQQNKFQFQYEIVTQIPKCGPSPSGGGKNGVHILPLRYLKRLNVPEARFKLLESGKIIGKHSSGTWITVPENSCIDGIMNYGDLDDPKSYTGDDIDQAIISCPILDQSGQAN